MTLRCLTSLKLNSLLTRYFRVSKDFYKDFVTTKSACHLELEHAIEELLAQMHGISAAVLINYISL